MKSRTMNDARTGKKKNVQIFLQKDSEENIDNIDVIPKKATNDDIVFIIKSLKESFVFFNLNDSEFDEIIANMTYSKTNKGAYIFKEQDPSTCFYIIDQGRFNVEINGQIKKQLGRGVSFGELGLLYNSQRSASLKAVEDCYVWGIERKTFKKIIQSINSNQLEENKAYIEKIRFFQGLSDHQKHVLASNLTTQKFVADQNIVNKGEKADSYYYIKQGTVVCYDGDKKIRELGEGESFGETALYKEGFRALTVRAKTETHCLVLSKETMVNCLGDNIESMVTKHFIQWTLCNDILLKDLTKLQIQRWVNNVTFIKKTDQNSEALEYENSVCNHVYIVIEGQLNYGEEVYGKGSIFCKEIFQKEHGERLQLKHDLSVSEAKFAVIQIADLKRILRSEDLTTVLEKNKMIHFRRKSKMMIPAEKQKEIELKDLIFVKVLGEGQFGIVFLVAYRGKGITELFALKTVSRAKIVQYGIESHIVNEKKVLEELDHPNILKLHKTYKDAHAIHFLLSFIKGIEMFDMIRQIDLFENYESKFYIGSIILCLEYLHRKEIVYRDLKPENIIIDGRGYLHLIDMGTAKKIEKGRTYTILGTPHYMAPEVIQSKGYGTMVDLWSLGVCMYEFMCGFVPFGEEEDDPFNVYRLIINSSTEFPPYFLTNKNIYAKQFITLLLSKIPEARLNGSYVGLKAHKWFEDFDWVS